MSFTVKAEIPDNVTIVDNHDGTWTVYCDVKNPQANSYTFYWDFNKAGYSYITMIEVTPIYRDIESKKYYSRYIKDMSTSALILDKFEIDMEGRGSVSEIVMRNEDQIGFIIKPDSVLGGEELSVMVKSNPLLFSRG